MGGGNEYTTAFPEPGVCYEAILMLHFKVWLWDLLSTKLLTSFLTKCVDNREAIKLRSNFNILLLQFSNQNFFFRKNRLRYCHCNYRELFYCYCNVSFMRSSFCKLGSSWVFFFSYAPVTTSTAKCSAAATRVQEHNNYNKTLLCNINQDTRSTEN